ncbi:MAG: ribosome small subunit-dependent GTPase A [Candidatus Korobacteraceae bacterium]
MQLYSLGWNEQLAASFSKLAIEGAMPARVAVQHSSIYRVFTEEGEMLAELAGKLKHELDEGTLPVVGDWVAVSVPASPADQPPSSGRRATIHHVLPRHNQFSRKAAGRANREQVLAANVDTVFIVAALDRDYNLRRIERYLAMVSKSGADAVVLLNKADLCSKSHNSESRDTESYDSGSDSAEEYDAPPSVIAARVAELQAVAIGIPVHTISAKGGIGMEQLGAYLQPGRTAVLLGSSGVGKSTITNTLLGEMRIRTAAVRSSDDRGMHTTTRRELILLPGGGLLIDTPGLRELQLWDATEGLDATFEDIEGLAAGCRFRDCGHSSEPGCAVQQALVEGTIPPERLENYHRLQRELAELAARTDTQAALQQKQKSKAIHKALRKHYSQGPGE